MGEVSTFTPERPPVITPADAIELTYLSLGDTAEQAAAKQVVAESTTKARRGQLKKNIGARTLRQAVALGIQYGFLLIKPEEEPVYNKLSSHQEAVLRLMALGWTSAEIKAKYGLGESAFGSNVENIKKKLGAKNHYHAIRRAFELGTFKIGEPILGPDDPAAIDDGDLQIEIAGRTLKLDEIGINDPYQLELFRLMGQLSRGLFNRQTMYELDFFTEAPSDRAKAQAYGHAVVGIVAKLQEAFGGPVLERDGVKNYHDYYFTQDVSIGPADDMRLIPRANRQKKPSRQPGRPRVKSSLPTPLGGKTSKILAVTLRATTPLENGSEPKAIVIKDQYLQPELLPSLDEQLLNNLQPRDPNEIYGDAGVKKVIAAIMNSSDTPFDYKQRLLIPLRFGVPWSQNTPVFVKRGDQTLSLREIMAYVPPYRGLDVTSTSLVSGIKPYYVVKGELDFLLQRQKDFPALRTVIGKTKEQLRLLEAQRPAV